jgi:iron complex outermembrane receptor protein
MMRKRWSRSTDARPGSFLLPLSLTIVVLWCCALPWAAQAPEQDYYKEGEALFGTAVVESASKFTQKEDEVPGTMTVVTRDEIRRYGFQTLSEVINFASMGGFTSYDRSYNYIGMRGMFSFDDYNTRVVLLLNGHLLNEPSNNFAGMDREMLIPMDLVERVEILYGPWGVLYGSSNLYGMINVVTRSQESLQGASVRLSGGSQSMAEGVLSWASSGKLGDHDSKILISGGEYGSQGPRTNFPHVALDPSDPLYWPITWDGGYVWGGREVGGADRERSPFLFLDSSLGEFRFTGRWGYRDKHFPLAPTGSVWGDDRAVIRDTLSYAEVKWAHPFSEAHALTASASYDGYRYKESEPYYDPAMYPGRPGYLWTLETRTRRVGGELKYNAKFAKGELVAGTQYRSEHLDSDIQTTDIARVSPARTDGVFGFSQTVWNGYVLGQWSPAPALHLSAGANYVKYSYLSGVCLYRIAAVWRPTEPWIFKAAFGKGFRAPSWYEFGYEDAISSLRNPDVKPEQSPAAEASVTWVKSRRFQATMTLFWQRNDQYIVPMTITDFSQIQGGAVQPGADPTTYLGFTQYQNIGQVKTTGGGLSLKGDLGAGMRGHVNLSVQNTRYREHGLSGKPSGSPQVNGNAGLGGTHGRFSWGAACFFIGPMQTEVGHIDPVREVGGYFDWRVRAAIEKLFGKELRLELLVTNAFNANQQNPVSSIYVPDTVRRSHRQGTLSLIYRF